MLYFAISFCKENDGRIYTYTALLWSDERGGSGDKSGKDSKLHFKLYIFVAYYDLKNNVKVGEKSDNKIK